MADRKAPPHPRGVCHGRGRESQQARHNRAVIHLFEMTKADSSVLAVSAVYLRFRTQSCACADDRSGDCCRARTTQCTPPMRKYRSFRDAWGVGQIDPMRTKDDGKSR